MAAPGKLSWSGMVLSVQPRIRLTRSYDERQHSYLGYVLSVRGAIADESRGFLVALGTAAQEKHQFRAGDVVRGEGVPVEDPRMETADLYRVSKLEVVVRGSPYPGGPPWRDAPPALAVYRARGSRRLDSRTYDGDCATCQWGCRMPVEMIIDPWKPDRRRHRTETSCYGPLSCPNYRAGPTRKVPGRRGMTWEEEDWVDEQEVSHRRPDE